MVARSIDTFLMMIPGVCDTEPAQQDGCQDCRPAHHCQLSVQLTDSEEVIQTQENSLQM